MTTAVRAATLFVLCITILGLTGIVGCPFSPDDAGDPPPPPPVFKPNTAPESLLYNLKMAYTKRDVAEYESLLANNFTFLLSEEDQSQPDLPDQWGRDDEIQIHRNMFDSEIVQQLTLTFEMMDQEWEPTENMWSILIYNVNLNLYGIIPGDEDPNPQSLKVENSSSRFWFAETGPATGNTTGWNAPGTSNRIWKIVKWQDNPN